MSEGNKMSDVKKLALEYAADRISIKKSDWDEIKDGITKIKQRLQKEFKEPARSAFWNSHGLLELMQAAEGEK